MTKALYCETLFKPSFKEFDLITKYKGKFQTNA